MKHDKVHKEIEENDVIERYVLNRLSADERRAFQEHFFECEQCFEQAQASSHFIAGVRTAAKTGVLTRELTPAGRAFSSPFGPALAFSLAASLLLAIALGWLWFGQVPDLRQEIARLREERVDLEKASQAHREDAQTQIEDLRSRLETEQARLEEKPSKSAAQASTPAGPQANTPIVTLESSRDSTAGENRIVVPPDANNVVLWITVEPGSRFDSFTVRVETKDRRLIETMAGAKPNQYGALSVGVPANRFQPGQYVIKLYGARGQQRELLGEYDLRVVRK
jgi:hypothetical protein